MLGPRTRVRAVDAARGLSSRLPGTWGRRLREAGKLAVDYKGARSTARRMVGHCWARRRSDLLVAPFGAGRMVVDAGDDEIGRVVYVRGGYEREYMATAVSRLSATGGWSPAGGSIIDVGANIGTTTVDALLHFGFARAICFEPDPLNVRLLRTNVALNELHDRVDVYPWAVADHDGTVVVTRSPCNSGDSRVSAQGDGHRVICRRLDGLVADGAIDLADVRLLWIDVQGLDGHVLAGAASLLEAGVPTVVEYWPASLADTGGLDVLEGLITRHFRQVIDLRLLERGVSDDAVVAAADIGALRATYGGQRVTDLLLVR